MLDFYSSFLRESGNGYYWVTAHDRSRPHRIEVRRADQGCRTFGLSPGNWHHSLTGESGGLWRTRGRPPNQLFGPVQNAASGDEIDRLDHDLGSPKDAVIIVTSKLAGGHSDK